MPPSNPQTIITQPDILTTSPPPSSLSLIPNRSVISLLSPWLRFPSLFAYLKSRLSLTLSFSAKSRITLYLYLSQPYSVFLAVILNYFAHLLLSSTPLIFIKTSSVLQRICKSSVSVVRGGFSPSLRRDLVLTRHKAKRWWGGGERE